MYKKIFQDSEQRIKIIKYEETQLSFEQRMVHSIFKNVITNKGLKISEMNGINTIIEKNS